MTRFEDSHWGEAAYAQEYRDNADHFLPERRVLLSVLTSFYQRFVILSRQRRVLDLGCGDGVIGHLLSSIDPEIRLSAIDGSAEMVEAARRRLHEVHIERLAVVTFQQIIRREVDLGLYDFVVSSFAIHHVDQTEKRALFQCIFDMLKEGSCFMNIDVMLPSTSPHEEWYYDLWREWIIRHEQTSGLSRSFADFPDEARHRPENHYDTLADQLEALSSVGFTGVECHYRYGLFGIYSGTRPHS
jgi:tRNA (cmo5U34)-methyltransferase